ncbi:MAG: FAD-dependent oxidoreductase [Nanoarchaeota archaeon]
MGKKEIYDVLIIGSGISAFAAAIYTKRLNLKTIIIGREIGGTLVKVDWVENYPGFKRVTGAELVNKVIEHAKEYDIEIYNGEVLRVSKKNNNFIIETRKKSFTSKTIIFCTGSERRKLKIPGEKEFENKGVHYCGMCDAPMYKNKNVAVIGGSDSAIKDAILISKYAKKVYLISRSAIKAEHANKEMLKREKKIETILNAKLKEIKGNQKANSLILEINNKQKILDIDGIFIDIGQLPASALTKDIGISLNSFGEIIIDKESKTNISGVYAAGDVTDTKFKQAITGVGEAVKAVYSAYDYLNKK